MSEYNIILLNERLEETPIITNVYKDDTIEELKYKISKELDVKDIKQYYFFYKKNTNMNPYHELKKYFDKNHVITKETLDIFISNHDIKIDIPLQETYNMDDLVSIHFPIIQSELEPLGIHIKEKIYSVNPFLHDKLYDVLSQPLHNVLLLDYPNIKNNTIYLVLLSDLTNFLSHNIKTYSKVYFPDIYKSKNFDLSTIFNPDYSTTLISIEKHKEFYKNNALEFKENIKSLSCILYPKEDVYIPVDLLFKVMNSTREYPMVQMKLEREQEQMMRLFTNNEYSKNHMAIPFLPKSTIFKWSKQMKNQTIQIFMDEQMIIEMNNEGHIMIHINNNTIQEIEDLEKWIKEKTSNLLDVIIRQFDPGENIFRKFNHFYSNHIELIKMNYEYELLLNNKIEYSNIKNYFNSIFNYNGNNNEIFLKFIRVSNYIESDNVRSRILYLMRENYDTETIIENLETQFPNVDIRKKINEVYELTDMKENVRRKKRFIVSPGIDIAIRYKKMNGDFYVYHVEIMNITNYGYIEVIMLYLSNLFRILMGESPGGLIETQENIKPYTIQKNNTSQPNNEAVALSEDVMDDEDELADYEDEVEAVDKEKDYDVNKVDVVDKDEWNEDVDEDEDILSEEIGNDDVLPEDEVINIDDPTSNPVNETENTLIVEPANEEANSSNDNSFDVMAQYKRGGAPKDVTDHFKNRYPLLSPLKKSNNKLFNTIDYARRCPAQERRQPIVLTNEEKKKIESIFRKEKEYKEQIIGKIKKNDTLTKEDNEMIKENMNESEFNSIKSKLSKHLEKKDKELIITNLTDEETIPSNSIMEIDNNHYMCSLYWDFKKDVPISEKKANKLSKHVFSDTKFNAKNPIPEEKYIFKMFRDQFPNKDIVGLLKGNSPCCFSKPKTEKTIRSNWILDHSKLILDENRIGHLTENLSNFFKYDSRKKLNDKNELIEDCILRKGTGTDNSFLKSIVKIFGYSDVNYLIETIIEKVNLDTILTFHNGKLPSIFYNDQGVIHKDKSYKPLNEKYIKENYDSYVLYKKMIKHNKHGLFRIINGLENFHAQLYKFMDYVYLWDIISSGILRLDKPNIPINMILLNDVNDDTTNKIELLCPMSDYSKYQFDTAKYDSCIIYHIKKENYQPIIIKKKKEKKKEPNDEIYIFQEMTLVNQLNKFLKQINYDACGPRRKTDDYKMNITLPEIIELLPEDYKIKRQLVNYNGQVIAGLVSYKDQLFYLPCRPSNITPNVKYYVMGQQDDHIFNDYNSTFIFLKELKQKEPLILCDVVAKIKQEGKIIGFLTETNQYIGLSSYEEDTNDDGLNDIEDDSYLEYDKVVSEEKIQQLDEIFRLKLEERFYSLFFQKMKIILSDIKLFVKKRTMIDIITNNTFSLNDKISKIHELLEKHMNAHFEFTNIDEDIIEDLILNLRQYLPYKENQEEDIIENIDKNKYTNNHCVIETPDNKCIIPLYNLYTKEPNHKKYIKKLSENLIRNYKIYKSFFYESYIVNPVRSYKLNKSEILLFKSNLEQYYEQLNDINKYKVYYDISPTKFDAFLDYAEKSRIEFREKSRYQKNDNSFENEKQSKLSTIKNVSANKPLDKNVSANKPLDKNENAPIPETRLETRIQETEICKHKPFVENLHRVDTETEYKELMDDECVEKSYFGNKTKWKSYFPKYTTYLRFNTNTNDCNYLLLNYIDKCELLEETKKKYIKNKLLKAYKKINFNTILPYLKKDGKNIENESFIQDESYGLTLTDMVIYCYYYQLPVMFCRLERIGRTKKFDIVLYDFNYLKSPYRYYIRIMNNNQFDLLYYYKSGIRMSEDIFDEQSKPTIKYLTHPIEETIQQLYV